MESVIGKRWGFGACKLQGLVKEVASALLKTTPFLLWCFLVHLFVLCSLSFTALHPVLLNPHSSPPPPPLPSHPEHHFKGLHCLCILPLAAEK